MGHDKTTWVNDATGISADRMQNLESQYADAMAMADNGAFNYMGKGSRGFNTVYQNTLSGPMFVTANAIMYTGCSLSVYTSASLSGGHPTNLVAKMSLSTGDFLVRGLAFFLPAGHYYEVVSSGTVTAHWWSELALYEEET